MPFPMTWSAGNSICTNIALAWETVPVLFPSSAPQPIPLQLIRDAIRYSNATVAILIPLYIKEFAKLPEYLHTLKQKRLEIIGYAGAALEESVIDKIKPYVDMVQPFFGNTELGLFPIFSGNGPAVGFDPNTGTSFEHVQDDLYELVITRDTDLRKLQYRFHMEPHTTRIPTNDLFRPHPTKQYFWLPAGRKDDLIKNHFLAKAHGTEIESVIELDEHVSGACFGGQDKGDPFLLIEVDDTIKHLKEEEITDKVWPAVQKVNASLSHEIQLKKSNFIIVTANRSLPPLGKGTIDRRAVLELYKEKVAALEAA